ncbi:hypothetical protein A3B93_00280 [Candidatus Nomurabacteria bacterium RIFCSPHIGHO2_02_FULL_42_24]|uniref:Bacterial spore germination immunoglobulin-like domain-containing protein n=1 Tax=Candidatus Nomurabacteria bacterium RIFCSPHIGHO2_02_FULL_42_24 TaxID=1801757 RepID=A0A1F6WLS5_9BACT|nr:MAG: hypothetical protein A3B93_00280 [Candidatus Nomurabacteria bacterium RIFCSPHIGHO2_02_FULL_42_24]
MKNKIIILLLMVAIAILAYFAFIKPQNTNDNSQIPAGDTANKKDNLEILGNKNDLVSFSIVPGEKVSGVRNVTGSVQGGYFFEGNIIINILDADKNPLPYGPGYAQATTDWMTAGPVSFAFDLDFSAISKGPAYIEIHNDNPSDLREYDKNILIPIVIE